MIANIDIRYDRLNTELRSLLSRHKDQSLKNLLSQSNNINTIIRKTKEVLKSLREKAETNMNFRDTSYQELLDCDIPNLVVPEFTSDKNIITFIYSIKKIMREKLLNIHVLKTILKNKVNKKVYAKLTTDVFTRENYDIKDIIEFFVETYAHPREL